MGLKFPYQKIPFLTPGQFIARPFLPVQLIGNGKKTALLYGLLDSGCDLIIFPADAAKGIGIDNVETGIELPIAGFAGEISKGYVHYISIQVLGDSRELQVEIAFLKKVPQPLLGRIFFRQYKLIMFREGKEEIELVLP